MSGYIDYLYGVPPAQLRIGQLQDLILELARGDHDLASLLRDGGVPTAERFIAKVYSGGDVASDVEDNYAIILGALRAYETKSQPVSFRQRLEPIGLETLKGDIISLAHWAYAGAIEPDDEKQVEGLVDQIMGLIADIEHGDKQTSSAVELLAAATIDIHHWAHGGIAKPEDRDAINSISNRITDHLDRLGAFDDPDM